MTKFGDVKMRFDTDGKLYMLNGRKIVDSVMKKNYPTGLDSNEATSEFMSKVMELNRKYWFSNSKVTKKKYFSTVDVDTVDMGDFGNVDDVKKEIYSLMDCSLISKEVGGLCLYALHNFFTLELAHHSDGTVEKIISTREFVGLNGEFYVSKSGMYKTVSSFVWLYDNLNQNSAGETNQLH
jgi:hypothetical protein